MVQNVCDFMDFMGLRIVAAICRHSKYFPRNDMSDVAIKAVEAIEAVAILELKSDRKKQILVMYHKSKIDLRPLLLSLSTSHLTLGLRGQRGHYLKPQTATEGISVCKSVSFLHLIMSKITPASMASMVFEVGIGNRTILNRPKPFVPNWRFEVPIAPTQPK